MSHAVIDILAHLPVAFIHRAHFPRRSSSISTLRSLPHDSYVTRCSVPFSFSQADVFLTRAYAITERGEGRGFHALLLSIFIGGFGTVPKVSKYSFGGSVFKT